MDDPLSIPQKFLKTLENVGKILITTHFNPDPDAIASCAGVQKILNHLYPQKQVIIGYSGVIGRVENQALLKECSILLIPLRKIEIEDYSTTIMVDCQYSQKNHPLSEPPLAVIDHHPIQQDALSAKARFSDIRPECGASSTIIYFYMKELQVPIDAELATALLYGIKTDTMELSRSTLDSEFEAYAHLIKLADKTKLTRIIHASVKPLYFLTFKEALDQAFLLGENLLLVPLGDIENPDVPAQIAEFFIRLEGIFWVVVMGFWQEALYLSVRSNKTGMDAGQMIQEVLADMGKAGGHDRAAGGKVPLMDNSKEGKEVLAKRVMENLAEHFGLNLERHRRRLI